LALKFKESRWHVLVRLIDNIQQALTFLGHSEYLPTT